MSTPKMNQGPPYRPTVWGLGGTATANIDIPITAVFLALFIIGAITHMTIFQLNNRRGHKFVFNAALFGFCMSRIVTTTLRIASISLPTNLRLAMAAQIFVAAAIFLIFVINLLWTQRIVRSLHPHIGWHRGLSKALRAVYVLLVLTVVILITAVVQSFYTLRPRTKTIDRDLQLYGTTFFAIVSFLPIPVVLISLVAPRKTAPDEFGKGRLRTKIIILLTGATLLCLGASYRCGTLWLKPVPRTQPLPPYFHRACFYIFNFTIEIIVVYMYAIMRVDLRFHVPNGARGTYAVQPEPQPQPQPLADYGSDVEMGGAAQEEEVKKSETPTLTSTT
ncbi:hypothetical protein K505DRAFT_270880 [Melanomma pulvis-pyrius CBS 109.77]|uniref:Family c-likeg-protein-coupled receptor protein n=1 Tax=Melanomma pulvis-pyrius CBS 109.77 TaxID=1314802 RepID=A0A6A6XJW5_9PLEO|nr:hypothetical protein K505DRAFT_270880 [Melanomma pulvis-pyrius CBS 109.77]